MIALHASLLARRTGRPVRMIYDRHEDLSATTKRHPAIVRHRTGLTRDGRIVAQDIDLVLDGGAYTHPDAGRPLAGHDPRRRAVRRRERPDPRPGGGDQHAAQRRVPRVRGATDGVRRRDAGQPRRGGARHVAARAPAAQRLPAGRHHAHAGRSWAATSPGMEVLDRAAEASEFERARARTAADAGCAAGERTHRTRDRPGARLARRGLHRLGRGEDGLGREPRAHRRRPDPDPDRLDRDGTGDEDDLPAAGRRGARGRHRRGGDGRARTPRRARLGPTVASRTAMVVGGLVIHAARRLKAEVEDRTGRPFGLAYRDDARDHGPDPHRPAVRALSRAATSTTPPTRAMRIPRSAGRPPWPRWRWTSTRPRWPCCRSWPRTTSGG